MKDGKIFKRIPRHVGIIPDGNRRWAVANGLSKQEGYKKGVPPGFLLYRQMLEYGIKEATFYGFTHDNTSRPVEQKEAFVAACVEAVMCLADKDANLLVVGNTDSSAFPQELLPYANKRVQFGKGKIDINFLVNYDWHWDIAEAEKRKGGGDFMTRIASHDISRIDMIVRWGGHTRLSGLLPAQSVYADMYVLPELWPDFQEEQFVRALLWYQDCDVTLGG